MINWHESAVPARYWHALEDGRVQCDLCPHACRLRDGQAGLCFVRACRGGAMILPGRGRTSGFCIDPIEKKPLHHFLPGTPVLSFGTAGCNLACHYCQNEDISRSRRLETLCHRATPAEIADCAVAHDCRSVAFTYNEPVIFLEYAVEVAQACRERGVRAVAVTAGYVNFAPRRELFANLDAVNVDLKSFDPQFYRHYTGGRLGPVLDTLAWVAQETALWLEITTLLVEGLNDSDTELDALTRWVVDHLGPDVPLHFTAFHPAGRMADRWPTPPSTLARARRIARANGVRYAYTGNVRDAEGASTHCPQCGTRVVERDGYRIRSWRLDADGRCGDCAAPIPGRFEAQPGPWDGRHQPVRVGSGA